MKILILTEGGRGIGLGHITRCLSLCQAFKERGMPPRIIVNGDKSVRSILKNEEYELLNWHRVPEKIFDAVRKKEIVIIDSYLPTINFYREVSKLAKIVVYIDDMKRMTYPKGVVVNGAIGAQKLDYSPRKDVVYLLGARYVPLRKAFWDVPAKKIKKYIKSVLVTFGGDDPGNMMPKILHFLKKNQPALIKNIVVGNGFKNVREIKSLKDKNSNLIYSPDDVKMRNLMLESDIAISAGGQTLYELARIGVPTVAFAVAGNQLHNVTEWKEIGFIEYMGRWEGEKSLTKLSSAIEKLSFHSKRLLPRDIGRSTVDGKGANRVVTFLENMIKKEKEIILRPANLQDCNEMLVWRNHRETKQWSFDKRAIAYRQHKQWLNDKLRDKNTRIYIAVDKEGEKIGQARLEKKCKGCAYINVNLNPNFFGMGFGTQIIKKATKFFIAENPGIKKVVAEIIQGNIASEKAFKKAGYLFSNRCIKYDRKVNIFNSK